MPLRLADVVITGMSAVAVLYLLFAAWGEPGMWGAVAMFTGLGFGAPVLRALHRKFPKVLFFDFLGSFWPLPARSASRTPSCSPWCRRRTRG